MTIYSHFYSSFVFIGKLRFCFGLGLTVKVTSRTLLAFGLLIFSAIFMMHDTAFWEIVLD